MVSAGDCHTVLLRSDGSAVAIGENRHGQCDIPALNEGMAYAQVSAGRSHTVLLRSDGSAVAIGQNGDGQCDIPPLEEGITYTQISAASRHTVLLRSDGFAVAAGETDEEGCNIPALDEGLTYTNISAGFGHTVLLRSDGCAVAIGRNVEGQCNIPPLDEGMTYTQISAGFFHTVLLRSDGSAVAVGGLFHGQSNIPTLDEGMAYTQISAGRSHTVLLLSDGSAVAIGGDGNGQCNIPPLEEGLRYAQISAGFSHTVLLRSDGSAMASGRNKHGECHIPLPEPGICYVGDLTRARDLAIQLKFLGEENAVTLICSTLAGEERLRVTTQGIDSAWETHKRIAREMNVNLPNLQLVLPDGELLAKVCRANPGASVAEVLVPTAGATWQGLKILGGALSLAAEQTYGYVLWPLAGGLYSYLFLPVVHGITFLTVGTAQAVGYVLSAVASGVTKVAGASYQYVLQPLGSAAAAVGQAVYSYVLRPLPGALYNVLSAFASAVAVAAGGCYQYLLLPVGSAVADLGRASYSYVLLPCGRAGVAAASFVVQVGVQWDFNGGWAWYQGLGVTTAMGKPVTGVLRTQRFAKRAAPRAWAKAKREDKQPVLPDLYALTPQSGAKGFIGESLYSRGPLPPPPDWKPAATLEDFLAQQREHCIKVFGDLCTKMHDYAFTSVTLTDHRKYGFRQGLANVLDATGMPLKEKDEWARTVAKVDLNEYNFDNSEHQVYLQVQEVLYPDPVTSGTWLWMLACFQAVPEALRQGLHVVMFNQGHGERGGEQLDLATGELPTRQFALAELPQ
eukprot:s416_g25.t2